jgi:hypothetical protein
VGAGGRDRATPSDMVAPPRGPKTVHSGPVVAVVALDTTTNPPPREGGHDTNRLPIVAYASSRSPRGSESNPTATATAAGVDRGRLGLFGAVEVGCALVSTPSAVPQGDPVHAQETLVDVRDVVAAAHGVEDAIAVVNHLLAGRVNGATLPIRMPTVQTRCALVLFGTPESHGTPEHNRCDGPAEHNDTRDGDHH